ncbi:unnamed protein product [Malus baccata var. baccata]
MNQLPEYMKVCYQMLLDIYSEIHKKLTHGEKLHRIHHRSDEDKDEGRQQPLPTHLLLLRFNSIGIPCRFLNSEDVTVDQLSSGCEQCAARIFSTYCFSCECSID